MRYKLTFGIGFAAGYVLGAKAGHDRYDQIMSALRRFSESPGFQSAAGVLQEQASELVDTAKQKVTGDDGHKATADTGFASAPYPPTSVVR